MPLWAAHARSWTRASCLAGPCMHSGQNNRDVSMESGHCGPTIVLNARWHPPQFLEHAEPWLVACGSKQRLPDQIFTGVVAQLIPKHDGRPASFGLQQALHGIRDAVASG